MTPSRESIKRALNLWGDYSKEYQNMLKEYEEVKGELRRLKISTRALPQSIIRDYPDIVFLHIVEEYEARIYLMDMNQAEVNRLILKIEDLPFNYPYATIRSYVIDGRWRIKTMAEESRLVVTAKEAVV